MRKRHATALGVSAGLAAAFLAHLVYWYLPRERPGEPSSEASAVLAEAGWEAVAWVGYPHQNLGAVERRIGDLRRWLALVAGDDQSAGRRLPSFGPWLLPPSRELVVAVRGEGATVELDVYPSIAWLARISGRLASNPWLSGGEVALDRRRRATVEWSDGRWRLRTGIAPAAAAEGRPGEPTGEALAHLRLGNRLSWLPAGLYQLERVDGSLELRSGALGERPVLPPFGSGASPPAAWRVERKRHGAVEAIVLWEEEGVVPPFPAALALGRGRRARLRVPGEELLRIGGGAPIRSSQGELSLRALSRQEIERGAPLAEELTGLLDANPRLSGWGGARPDRLAPAAERLARELSGLPLGHLLGVDPGRLVSLLAPLRGCSATVVETWRRPNAVRWRICVAGPASPR